MDAIKFIETRNEICNAHELCRGCPFIKEDIDCFLDAKTPMSDYVCLVKICEEYAAGKEQKNG